LLSPQLHQFAKLSLVIAPVAKAENAPPKRKSAINNLILLLRSERKSWKMPVISARRGMALDQLSTTLITTNGRSPVTSDQPKVGLKSENGWIKYDHAEQLTVLSIEFGSKVACNAAILMMVNATPSDQAASRTMVTLGIAMWPGK
jgi:hypothetical protein